MALTESEAQIRDLREALDYATELTAYDREGRPVTARRCAMPYDVWDFSGPDDRRARVPMTDPVKVFKLVRSIAMFGEWPQRMKKMPEFAEIAAGER